MVETTNQIIIIIIIIIIMTTIILRGDMKPEIAQSSPQGNQVQRHEIRGRAAVEGCQWW